MLRVLSPHSLRGIGEYCQACFAKLDAHPVIAGLREGSIHNRQRHRPMRIAAASPAIKFTPRPFVRWIVDENLPVQFKCAWNIVKSLLPQQRQSKGQFSASETFAFLMASKFKCKRQIARLIDRLIEAFKCGTRIARCWISLC